MLKFKVLRYIFFIWLLLYQFRHNFLHIIIVDLSAILHIESVFLKLFEKFLGTVNTNLFCWTQRGFFLNAFSLCVVILLLFLLLVIIGIVNAFHEDFTVVDLVCHCPFQQGFDGFGIRHTPSHGF